MKIAINGQIKSFPVSLAEITLGQRIAFDEAFGRKLAEQLEAIEQLEDEDAKHLALLMYEDESACSYVAHFTGIPIDVVRKDIQAEIVLALNNVGLSTMAQEEAELKERAKTSFQWLGESWQLQAPVVTSSSPLSFGEYVDAKQIISDLAREKGSKWQLLHRIACIFLRRPDERYEQHMSEPDGERAKMMLELPLDIALSVGFFLTSWMASFKNHSPSSGQVEAALAGTLQGILTLGVGYTSSNPLRKPKSLISLLLASIRLSVHGKLRRLMFSSLLARTKSTPRQ